MKHTIINHKNFNEIQVSVNELKVSLLDLGATLKSINHNGIDLLLEYKDIESYNNNDIFLGSSIGRFAGRIKYDEKLFSKDIRNNGDNILHGGKDTSAKKIWKYEIEENDNGIDVVFTFKHEDDGFFNSLDTTITYMITDDAMTIKYDSVPNGESICNITNHAYFTLGEETINKLQVKTDGCQIALLDDKQLPNGEYVDMHSNISLTELDALFPDTKGIDHPIKLNKIFTLESSESIVEIESSYDYVVLYGQSYESIHEFANTASRTKAGLAVEFQHLPNDPKVYSKKQSEYIIYRFK